jgi:hypothetical protein
MVAPTDTATRALGTEIPIERARGTPHQEVVTRTGFRMSWGAVFAGLVLATALQLVLTTLGGALGLAAFDPGTSARAFGIGAAAWAVLTLLLSLFIGGSTTGRLAGVLSRTDAFLHGALVWALSTLLTVWLLSRGVGAVTGTAFRALGNVAGATAGAVARGATAAAGAAAGAASNDGTDTNRARNVDRNDVVNIIAARTGRSRAEAEQLADRATQAATDARTRLSSTAQTVRERAPEVAEDVASGASTGLWFALLGMGLGLAAAVFGAQRTARE